MNSPVLTITEGMKVKKQTKTEIWVGFFVKAEVGELENITREVRIRSTRKAVVGFVQDVMGKKKLLFQFKYGHKKEISSYFLVFLVQNRRLIWMSHYLILPKKTR